MKPTYQELWTAPRDTEEPGEEPQADREPTDFPVDGRKPDQLCEGEILQRYED
jgi:hypothetical protein